MTTGNKRIYLPNIGEVRIQKKKRMRNIRLRVDHSGEVIISLPRWVSLSQAVKFAGKKTDWIKREKAKRTLQLKDDTSVGGKYKLRIITGEMSRPRFITYDTTGDIHIHIPPDYGDDKKQAYIKRKLETFLRSESERILLPWLRELSEYHGYRYRSASVGMLRSRWGSCDHKGNIKLSAYLVQLPDHLIEYVLLHELNHTKNLNHSKKFWSDLDRIYAPLDKAKREIKQHRPSLAIMQ